MPHTTPAATPFMSSWTEFLPKPAPVIAPETAELAPTGTKGTVTITHTYEDGTQLTGSTRGDGVYEIVAQCGFTYRHGSGVHIRGSRDRDARTSKINDAARRLRADGWTVVIDIDNTWRTAEQRRAAADERANERADRLQDRAQQAAGEADRRYKAEHAVLDRIPAGQPVLRGHHSQAGHMRALERADSSRRAGAVAAAKAERLAERAAGVVAHAEHRDDPRAMMRRIEYLEANRRVFKRGLEGWTRNFRDAAGDVHSSDVHPPATGEHAEDLRRLDARDAEEIEYLRGLLAAMEESGTFTQWGPEHFAPGDHARVGGKWCKVKRVNKKSLSVIGRYFSMVETDHTDPAKWDEISGRRRDGMQWDTPNGEPWPVELARKVARWRDLLGTASRHSVNPYPFGSDGEREARHVGYTIRLVHGLDLDASDAQVKAIKDSITGVDDQRALAVAYLAVFNRLAADERVPDIAATLTPITGTPAWTIPTDADLQDVRVDQLQPGDLIAGVWDNGWGKRTLLRQFCGPVAHVSDVNNRHEAGRWVTVTLETGDRREFQTHRWLAVHRVAPNREWRWCSSTSSNSWQVHRPTPAPSREGMPAGEVLHLAADDIDPDLPVSVTTSDAATVLVVSQRKELDGKTGSVGPLCADSGAQVLVPADDGGMVTCGNCGEGVSVEQVALLPDDPDDNNTVRVLASHHMPAEALRTADKTARRVAACAARFAAETISGEPGRYLEPTDANLAQVLAACVKPPSADLYPRIRDQFNAEYQCRRRGGSQ